MCGTGLGGVGGLAGVDISPVPCSAFLCLVLHPLQFPLHGFSVFALNAPCKLPHISSLWDYCCHGLVIAAVLVGAIVLFAFLIVQAGLQAFNVKMNWSGCSGQVGNDAIRFHAKFSNMRTRIWKHVSITYPPPEENTFGSKRLHEVFSSDGIEREVAEDKIVWMNHRSNSFLSFWTNFSNWTIFLFPDKLYFGRFIRKFVAGSKIFNSIDCGSSSTVFNNRIKYPLPFDSFQINRNCIQTDLTESDERALHGYKSLLVYEIGMLGNAPKKQIDDQKSQGTNGNTPFINSSSRWDIICAAVGMVCIWVAVYYLRGSGRERLAAIF